MTAIETNLQNAYESTLTVQMTASDLTAQVVSLGSPSIASPCYLIIDPDDDEKREYILFDGTFTGTAFVTSNITNRYLSGSAYGSNITHEIGAVIRMVPMAQHFEDIHDRINSVDHGDLSGLGDDDHPQYMQSTEHNDAGIHNLLNINADTVDGQHASEFAPTVHDHDGDYAPDTHVGSYSVADHPVATTSRAGFMSSDDKTTLDALESAGGGVASIVAGTDIDVSGTTVVTVSHENTSSAASINNAPNQHIDALSVDSNGHVTAITQQTMSPGDIGAATDSHNHSGTYAPYSHISSGDHDGRYYTEGEIDSLLNFKAPTSNPSFTGTIVLDGVTVVDRVGVYTHLQSGGNTVVKGDGSGLLELGGVVYSAGAKTFDVQCEEDGALREIFYTPVASSERFKQDIQLSSFTGGECLKWNIDQFHYISDVEHLGNNAKTRHWVIAEKILQESGEAFIQRDDDGLVANTDDRAMLADVILTLQDAVEEIGLLKARIQELENAG